MATKKTVKQKEFDLMLKYANNPYELTKRIRTTDIELIRKYKDQLNWWNISQRKTLTNEFIDEFWDEMKSCINKIEVHPNMPTEFLEMNREYINWRLFVYSSGGARFTLDFIKKFEKELKPYFNKISALNNLPEESRKYIIEGNNKNFYEISLNTNISTALLDEYKDKFSITEWQNISRIARCLNKQRNFEKFEKYIDMYNYTSTNALYRNRERTERVLTEEFLLKYKDSNINWENIINIYDYSLVNDIENGKLTTVPLDFFIKHKNELSKLVLDIFKNYCTTVKLNDYYTNRWTIPWERE